MRRAAVLVGLQGTAGVVAAVVFVVRGLRGADQHVVSGFGNAMWFGVFGAALVAAGWALWTGKRGARGVAVYAQMLLLPVSWYVGVGSHQWMYAVPVAAVSVAIVVLLVHRSTIQWLEGSDVSGDAVSGGVDNSDSAGPDTR